MFEAVPTKLPHYTLPLYPALCLLAVGSLTDIGRWPLRIGRAGLVLAGGALAGAALLLPAYLYQPLWIGIPACVCTLAAAWLAWHRRLWPALLMCVPLHLALLQMELPGLEPLWIGPRAAALLRRDWPGWNSMGDGLAVAGYAEPSLVFLTGTRTQLLPNGASAAAALRAGRASAVLVAGTELDAFHAAMNTPRARWGTEKHVSGFNSSRGRWVTLTLVTQ